MIPQSKDPIIEWFEECSWTDPVDPGVEDLWIGAVMVFVEFWSRAAYVVGQVMIHEAFEWSNHLLNNSFGANQA